MGLKNGGEIISAPPFTKRPAGALPVARFPPVDSINPEADLTLREKLGASMLFLQTAS